MKKAFTAAGVALAVFFAVTQPEPAGEAVQAIGGWLKDGAEAIITFVQNIF